MGKQTMVKPSNEAVISDEENTKRWSFKYIVSVRSQLEKPMYCGFPTI